MKAWSVIEQLAKQTILLSFAAVSLERELATLPLQYEHYQNIKKTSLILKQRELDLNEFLQNRGINITSIRTNGETITYTIKMGSSKYKQLANKRILQYESKRLIERVMFTLVY